MIESPETTIATRADVLPALGWMVFLLSFPMGLLSFGLPIYGKELGATALEIGALFSAFSVMTVLLRPVLGRLIDRYGRRPFLLLGVIGYVAAFLLFLRPGSLPVLLVARLVQGAASSFMWLSAYAIVADCSALAERGRRFGRLEEQAWRGGLVGALIGFSSMGFLDDAALGWAVAFAVYTVLALVALVLAGRGVRETRPACLSTASARQQVSSRLYVLMGIVVVTAASSALLTPVLMIYLQERFQAPVSALAWAYLPAAILYGLLPSYLGRIADKVGRKGPMIVGLLAAAMTSFVIPFAGSILLLTAAWAIEAVCFSAATPAQEALVADYSGAEARGTGYGLYTLAFGLGSTIGPVAGGWVYDAWGHAVPFYLNAGLLVIGAALVLALVREDRPLPDAKASG